MSVAALASRIESAQGEHQRASDLLAELRSRFEPEEAPPPPEGEGGMSASDIGHTILDVAGMIPVIGAAADLINAGWYAAEGDYVNAGLSALGAVPGIGDAATAAKLGARGADAVAGAARAGDDVNDARRAENAATGSGGADAAGGAARAGDDVNNARRAENAAEGGSERSGRKRAGEEIRDAVVDLAGEEIQAGLLDQFGSVVAGE